MSSFVHLLLTHFFVHLYICQRGTRTYGQMMLFCSPGQNTEVTKSKSSAEQGCTVTALLTHSPHYECFCPHEYGSHLLCCLKVTSSGKPSVLPFLEDYHTCHFLSSHELMRLMSPTGVRVAVHSQSKYCLNE